MQLVLVVIVMDLNGQSIVPTQFMHNAYATEETCNLAGANFRSIMSIPKEKKSLSICVAKDWFEQSGWQRVDLG
ncbi:MAG: hypothetical protein P8J20_06530 [Novosphingobium sp.]|nr:hypothetical protein [Novosphingobium sp.]